VNPSPDPRLTDLFVRYWDGALTPAEHAELARRLAADPAARAEFRTLSVQAVAAAEPAVPVELPAPRPPAPRRWRFSRRDALRLAAGGTMAGVVGAVLTRDYWLDDRPAAVHLVSALGEVRVRTTDGETAAAVGVMPPDASLTTVGADSSAVLRFADGTEVSLVGESVATVDGRGQKLNLLRGMATATGAPGPSGTPPVTLVTTEASCSRLGAAALTISRMLRAQTTEVGAQRGRVSVDDAAGDPLEILHPGEYITVHRDGRHRKSPVPEVAAAYALPLNRPLPDGWEVGAINPDTRLLEPRPHFDTYHKTDMIQVRSDHRWYQGFARLQPDSRFRLRFRVKRPGHGQLVVCVRTDDLRQSDTGVLDGHGLFAAARPGEWETVTRTAQEMLVDPGNRHPPKFGAPWVAFLLIVNTYKADLGLEIAALEITPPA
jgi:hypothetical protein